MSSKFLKLYGFLTAAFRRKHLVNVRGSELFPSEKEFSAEVEFMSPGDFSPVTLGADREQLPGRCCASAAPQLRAGALGAPRGWNSSVQSHPHCPLLPTGVSCPGDTETTGPGCRGMSSREGGLGDLQWSPTT